MVKRKMWLAASVAGLALLVGGGGGAIAQQKELRVAYQPNPIQETSIDMMVKWGEKNGVKIVKVPNSYGVYVEKMTASLTSGSDQYDIIWHNDDWGQLWAHLVEPMDDVPGLKNADPWSNDPVIFNNKDGKITVVPMGQTIGALFYRTDLIKPEQLPKTWAELVTLSKKLQAEKKVKYGYVGAMAMNTTWFSFFWTLWNNDCDVLLPLTERDNAKLAKAGWKSAMDQPCSRQVMEFWWDAIHKDKIVPPGMPSYGRNEANAVFTAGDAAITVADTTYWGEFNNPAKSKAAGKVAIAGFPAGPMSKRPSTVWNEIWGWAIPKSIPAERKALAKKALSAIMDDKEGQIELWKKTGVPPPNKSLWAEIGKTDADMKDMLKFYLDNPNKVHSAYYFEKWPAVHKAFSDAAIKAVTGKREDIPKALAEGAVNIHNAAK